MKDNNHNLEAVQPSRDKKIDKKKLIRALAPACAAIIIVVCAVVLIGKQSAGERTIVGGGKPRAVAYNNALQPAPGTQMFDMVIKDGKLAKGPKEIHSVINGAFKIDVTAHTKAAELEFYVEHYTDNAEIDYPPEDQTDVLTGKVYIYTDQKGTFEYGVEDEATETKMPLGTLYVE